jgi:hypothetical protein
VICRAVPKPTKSFYFAIFVVLLHGIADRVAGLHPSFHSKSSSCMHYVGAIFGKNVEVSKAFRSLQKA